MTGTGDESHSGLGGIGHFQRSYAACDRCRGRKVKCVVHERPPCAKCRREHRECLFTKHRRNLKQREPPHWNSLSAPKDPHWDMQTSASQAPPSPIPSRAEDPLGSNLAHSHASLVERAVPALMVEDRDSDVFDTQALSQHDLSSYGTHPLPTVGLINPSPSSATLANKLLEPNEELISTWAKCRFVRQGWLTPQAAATYVELFFTLTGAGGVLRGQMLHQRLWEHCEALIRRILYGLEETSITRVRLSSTIESFLLLADWHPQSILFPLDHSSFDDEPEPADPQGIRESERHQGPSVQWRNNFLKPARRSNRMSLMMVGTATNLAYETGLFADNLGMDGDDESERSRRMRTRKMLYIYVTNIATKMGCPSGMPQDIVFTASKASYNALDQPTPELQAWNIITDLWLELVRLSKAATAIFFGSPIQTKRQLYNGQYVLLLQHITPLLDSWIAKFQATRDYDLKTVRDLLYIEYQSLRAYVHAVSMQAVVERASARSVEMHSQVDLRTTCFLTQDADFIHDVIVSSQEILRLATSMTLSGVLRLLPVRQTLSVISAAILLFKAISLGVSEADLQSSLEVLEGCISALKSSDVGDELEFSSRFANLIEVRMTGFKSTFFRPQEDINSWVKQRLADNDPRGLAAHVNAQPSQDGSLGRGDNLGQDFPDVDFSNADEVWARPFDPGLAPFSAWGDPASYLEIDSLDFLWNTPANN